MASSTNPVLSGIFRALELRSLFQNQRLRQEALDLRRQQIEARREREQRLEILNAQEKARSLTEQFEEQGFRLRPENISTFEQAMAEGGGESDFSIATAPGRATTASSGRLERVGGQTFFLPPFRERQAASAARTLAQKLEETEVLGEQNLEQSLAKIRAEDLLERELAPIETIGSLQTDESGNVFAVERDPRTRELTPRQVPGLKRKQDGPKLTASEQRQRRTEQRQQRQQAAASELLNKHGTAERALAAISQEAKENAFIRQNRFQIMRLLRQLRDKPTQQDQTAEALASFLGGGDAVSEPAVSEAGLAEFEAFKRRKQKK